MKQLGYLFFKYGVAIALFWYYKKIKVVGREHIPKNKPVIFLSNHQNALLDILLIATRCYRKPWYLTRADVFKNRLFKPLFSFLQMLPIYRIRDGRATLAKNTEIFKICAQLLNSGEALLVFPEANHSLDRRVRPLSKGFTRIIDAALELNNDIDLQLVPVGQNYQSARSAGDSAAIYFGQPIVVQDFKESSNAAAEIKQAVFEQMVTLTTHISVEQSYEEQLALLHAKQVDFTKPRAVNSILKVNQQRDPVEKQKRYSFSIGKILFRLINFPMVILWQSLLKPKVPEPEFEGTFRFGFSLLLYPLFYLVLFLILIGTYNIKTACLIIGGHAVLNLLLVKFGITSYSQRK